jgi:hypothetical protein
MPAIMCLAALLAAAYAVILSSDATAAIAACNNPVQALVTQQHLARL